MLLPIAIGATALFLLAQSSGKKVEADASATPATVQQLASREEYQTFYNGMGKSPLQASALLALRSDEDLDVDDLALKLGELGYTQLGVIVADDPNFDPYRARMVIELDGAPMDDVFENESLAQVLAEVDRRVEVLRDAKRAAAGAYRRKGATMRGLNPGEVPSWGRGLIPDGERSFVSGLNPGEVPSDGRGVTVD